VAELPAPRFGKGGKLEAVTPVTQSIPRGAVLDAWSGSEWDNGVQIDRIGELTTLAVRTTRSLYEITILNGHTGEVLVRGGGFFPERTPVQLTGSTFGGSILKRRGIYVGMRLEFVPQPAEFISETVFDEATGRNEIRAGHRVIWTSLIQSIEVMR
jgi:hypothetical protein